MLLGFVAWTVLLLVGTVGVYRWSRILTGLWRYEISGLIRLREKIGKTRNAGTCKLRRKSTRLCYDRLCIVRRKRDQQSREYIGHCNSDCPRSAIAGTCMLRSDKHRGVDTICFLWGSDHWLSSVDWHHCNQHEWEGITISQPGSETLVPLCADLVRQPREISAPAA